jgi:hypothetical protein
MRVFESKTKDLDDMYFFGTESQTKISYKDLYAQRIFQDIVCIFEVEKRQTISMKSLCQNKKTESTCAFF